MTQRRRHEILPVALIVLGLALAGYGSLLRPGRVPYSIHSDIVAMHLATKTVLYDSLRSGHGLPFWRDDQMSGAPAFTNPESQYTYPLHALFALVPPAAAVGPTIWIQLVAGALAMYWVGRVLGLGRIACLLMAVAQLFNFKLIAITYAGFLPVLPIATMFPLLFASLFLLMQEPGLKTTLLLAASAALCLNTGGFQLLYYAALLAAGYLLWQAVAWWRGARSGHAGKVLLGTLAAGCLSTGVMAYLLVPMLAESSLLSRTGASYDFFLSGYTLTPGHLLNFFYPESAGPLFDATRAGRYLWEDVAYFGIIPLGLAIVGAIRAWRRRHAPFLVVGFAVSLLLATETPLTRLLYVALPGFGFLRMPIRFVYLTGFFGIALAGIGLEETVTALRVRFPLGRLARLARALPVVLVVLIAAEGTFYAHRYIRTKPAGIVTPSPEYAAYFARDTTTFRIAPTYRYAIQPGWAAPMKLQIVTGALPYNFDHYGAYLELLQSGTIEHTGVYSWAAPVRVARRDLLDALNVKYVVSPIPLWQVEQAGFHEEAHLMSQPIFTFFEGMTRSDLYIYRNDRFLERAFWGRQVIGVKDRDGMIAAVQGHDLRTSAIVYGDAGPVVAPAAVDAPGDIPAADSRADDARIKVVESFGGHLALETHSRARRFLTISEVWHPGWRAVLDGAPLPLVPCDLALMGAWIPPGDHRVDLLFRPLYWRVSVGITVGFLVVWAAALLACGFRRI